MLPFEGRPDPCDLAVCCVTCKHVWILFALTSYHLYVPYLIMTGYGTTLVV
jgi:hypothetical protein